MIYEHCLIAKQIVLAEATDLSVQLKGDGTVLQRKAVSLEYFLKCIVDGK
jgi:hypothetical protein